MADLPIIFFAPMVRALLDCRKTMTRRILKPQPERAIGGDGNELPISLLHIDGEPRPRITIGRVITRQKIRYSVGDRLWVRENLCAMRNWGLWHDAGPIPAQGRFLDDVDERGEIILDRYGPTEATDSARVPSIHMPRWASRLTLLVTAIKIERLQDISEEDAIKEGVSRLDGKFAGCFIVDGVGEAISGTTAAECFRRLWSKLHDAGSWAANPYVVALTFSVHRCNIDALGKEAA